MDIESIKVLIAFGANVNATNQDGLSPLQMLQSESEENTTLPPLSREGGGREKHDVYCITTPSAEHGSAGANNHSIKGIMCVKCSEFLLSMGAVEGELVQRVAIVPSVSPFPQAAPRYSKLPYAHQTCMEGLNWGAHITAHFSELERNIQSCLQSTSKTGRESLVSPDTSISLAVQLQDMKLLQMSGSRILCLDGGGMKGLIQLETLIQLERHTGRKIIELFDWIIGTSTGGIIALGLVYGQ